MRMYEHEERYSDRPMLPPGHRSHSPEYRAPPRRAQRGGRGGLVGGPRGYDSAGPGLGGDADYDINMLMNLSKALS